MPTRVWIESQVLRMPIPGIATATTTKYNYYCYHHIIIISSSSSSDSSRGGSGGSGGGGGGSGGGDSNNYVNVKFPFTWLRSTFSWPLRFSHLYHVQVIMLHGSS